METSDDIFNNSANFFYRFGQVLFLESYYLNFGEIGKSKRKKFCGSSGGSVICGAHGLRGAANLELGNSSTVGLQDSWPGSSCLLVIP